jgi:YVTN family beta-propeller protein
MPPVLDPSDIYAADRPNALSPAVKDFPSLAYVPNSDSNTVDVIDPKTMKVVNHFAVGKQPQHVVPSYDLKTLYVTDDLSNDLVPIDAATGKPGAPIPVEDPYNLYFTPDGASAIVVAERMERLDFRDPHTMAIRNPLPVPCKGVDHMDFSADGAYLLASCEYAGTLIKVEVATEKVVGMLTLPKAGKAAGKPQDVKLSPDGRIFYVADMNANGVYEVDGATMKVLNFIPTGKNAHGLYVSRDSKVLYVSNRGEGSISVIDFASRKVGTTWHIPGGGSPDMGGVSADGTTLWLSGRNNSEVYAINTSTGQLVGRVKVGHGPHGLCLWPQPGRYSLGHTGILR